MKSVSIQTPGRRLVPALVLAAATVALTGCRFAEHSRRAAIDAFASFVLDSVSQAPLTQAAPKLGRGQALLPVPVRLAAVPPPAHDRQECLSSTEMTLFIGPEGGWSDDELRLAREHGCAFARLGPRRLRAETAAIVATALAAARAGDLD